MMNNYSSELKEHDWENDKVVKCWYNTDDVNFDVEMIVCENREYIDKVLIYAHTTGEFIEKNDAKEYIKIFQNIIIYVTGIFPGRTLYYIQNYQGFDPSKYIDYIQRKTQETPLKNVLQRLPFENQRRICEDAPKVVQQAMPNIVFVKNIGNALEELGLK